MSPGEIDEYVKARMAAGSDLYALHADALAALDPHLILTQDLCRVCALPSGHVSDALDYLGCRADVLSLDRYTLDEVLETILAIGARTGVPDRAESLVAGLRARLTAVASAIEHRHRPGWPSGNGSTHRSPPVTGCPTTYGQPVANRSPRAPAPGRTRRRGRSSPMPRRTSCSSHRAAATLTAPTRQARLVADLPGSAVWAIDADGIVVRPGPRLIDGVEAIAAILHPGAVPEPREGAVARVA